MSAAQIVGSLATTTANASPSDAVQTGSNSLVVPCGVLGLDAHAASSTSASVPLFGVVAKADANRPNYPNARVTCTNALNSAAGTAYFWDLAPASDNFTLNASDSTGVGSSTQLLSVVPSGARPYTTYSTVLPSALTGQATIAAGANVVNVAITNLTANAVVMVTVAQAAPDATATSFAVSTAAGNFNITANANATANVLVNWFVVKY